MNIDAASSSAARGDAARGSAARGAGQAEAAGAFAGLFAGLTGQQPAADAQATPAGAGAQEQAPAEDAASPAPELPIWPGLVQDAMPAAPADGDAAAAAAPLSTTAAAAGPPRPGELRAERAAHPAAAPVAAARQDASGAAEQARLITVPPAATRGDTPAAPAPGQLAAGAGEHRGADVGQGAQVPPAGPRSATPAESPLQAQIRPELPPRAQARPELPPQAQARPELPPQAQARPDAPPPTQARPDLPPAAQARPDLPPQAAAMARDVVAEAGLPEHAALPLRGEVGPVGIDSPRSLPDGIPLHTAPTQASVAARGPDAALAAGTPQPVPVEQLSQQAVAVIRQMGQGRSEARLELHPAELGQLDLEVRQDGQKLELSVAVDNEQSRRLIQDQLAQWRERLAESGLDLQRLDVNVREQGEGRRQDSDGPRERAAAEIDTGVNNSARQLIRDPDRALDIYA